MKRLLLFLLAVFPLFASAQKIIDLDLPHNRSITYTLDTLFLDHDSTYITSDTDSMKFVIDDVEALRLINEGTQSTIRLHNGATVNNIRNTNLTITEDTVDVVGVLTANSVASDAAVSGTTITGSGTVQGADLIATNMATTTTTVLTPTSTGQLDTLETTDLATADFTVTGDWTFDNLVADSISVDSISVTGDITVSGSAKFDYIVVDSIANLGGYNYGGAEAGGDDDYTITVSGVTAYTAGMIITFLATTDNTGACTLDVNGIGAGNIKDQKGDDPANSYIDANSFVMVAYDGTNFVLLTPNANP